MKYIINNVIIFTLAIRTLSLLNDDRKSIVISKPASRLLMELIKNNTTVIARQDLLKHVWEDYGFKGSNHNLNGAVSELRKCLEALSLDPGIIKTIPKVGFVMTAEIMPAISGDTSQKLEIKTDSETDTESDSETDTESDSETDTDTDTEENRVNSELKSKKSDRKKHYAFIILVMVLSLGVTAYLSGMNLKKSSLQSVMPLHLYTFENCNVLSLDDRRIYSNNDLIALAKHDLANEKIDCSITKKDIFYMKTASQDKLYPSTFIAVCNVSLRGIHSHCQNIKKINRS